MTKTDQQAAYQVVGDSGTSDTTANGSLVSLNTLSSATAGAQASQMAFMTDASAPPLATSTRGHHVEPFNHPKMGTGSGEDVPSSVDELKLVVNGRAEYFTLTQDADWSFLSWIKPERIFHDPLTPAGKFTLYEHIMGDPNNETPGRWVQVDDTKNYSHINKGSFTMDFNNGDSYSFHIKLNAY